MFKQSRWPLGTSTAILFLCLAQVGTVASADIIYVGSGCEESGLQAAIDEAATRPGTDELRLRSNLLALAPDTIVNGDLILSGGWTACGGATQSGNTTVLSTNGRAIGAEGGTLVLRNLELLGGSGTAVDVTSTDLRIESSILRNSNTGLRALGSATVEIASTGIHSNGRGVECARQGIGSQGPSVEVAGWIVSNDATGDGGGILATDFCSVALVGGALIRDNTATGSGGGIYVGPNASLSTTGGVTIDLNAAEGSGGGIAFAHNGASATLESVQIVENTAGSHGGGLTLGGGVASLGVGTVITDNTAGLLGGGIHCWNTVAVTISEGVQIRRNEARWGGGLSCGGSATVTGVGDGDPIEIVGNQAESGGGVRLGNSSEVLLLNTLVEENRAEFYGGGVYLEYDARYQQERGNFIDCASPPRCSTLSRNQVIDSSGGGAALWADQGAEVLVAQSYIEENHAPIASLMGTIGAEGAGTFVEFEGNQLWGNDSRSLFESSDGALIHARFVSAAENSWTFSLNSPPVKIVLGEEAGGNVELFSSIFVDTVGSVGGGVLADCLIVDSTTGLAPARAGTIEVSADPGFYSKSGADLHLRSGSVAIDFCDDAFVVPGDRDLDLEFRGHQTIAQPDRLGPWDLGADENPSVDLLFMDGFESGDTSAWPD